MHEIIDVSSQCQERFLDHSMFNGLEGIEVELAGLSVLRKWQHIDRQFEHHMLLIATLEGESHFKVGKLSGVLTSETLLFVPPRTRISLNLTASQFRRSAWVMLRESAKWQGLAAEPWFEPSPHCRSLAYCLELLDAERHVHEADRFVEPLLDMLDRYLRRVCQPGANQLDPRLALVIEAVQQDLAKAWSVPMMMRIAHVSKSHLYRLFTSQLSCSPHQWLTQARLEKAAQCLRQSSHPVSVIAEQVGYRTASHFVAQFSQHHGATPAQFRQRHGL